MDKTTRKELLELLSNEIYRIGRELKDHPKSKELIAKREHLFSLMRKLDQKSIQDVLCKFNEASNNNFKFWLSGDSAWIVYGHLTESEEVEELLKINISERYITKHPGFSISFDLLNILGEIVETIINTDTK